MDKSDTCSECDTSFSSHYNLQRHKRRYHEMDSEDIDESNSSHESEKTSYQGDDSEATDDTYSYGSEKTSYKDDDSEATDDTHSSQENETIDETHSSYESEEDGDSIGSRENSVTDHEASHSEGDETDRSHSDNEEELDDFSNEENKSNPNEILIDDVLFKHADEFQGLLQHYKEDGLSKKDATAAAFKALRPHYRKDLKKKFANYISNMMEMRQTPLFQSILNKIKYLEDEGFDNKEAIKSAISYRKYSIYNQLNSYIKNLIHNVTDDESNMEHD